MTLTTLKNKLFENIVEKGENDGTQNFHLFPQCFLPFQIQIPISESHFFLSSVNSFDLDQSKNLSFGKELTLYYTIPTFNDPKGGGFRKHCVKWRK